MRIVLLCLAMCLVSCREQQPAAPTEKEAAQLNEAEDMLNDAANEEGPADRSTGPSNSTD